MNILLMMFATVYGLCMLGTLGMLCGGADDKRIRDVLLYLCLSIVWPWWWGYCVGIWTTEE